MKPSQEIHLPIDACALPVRKYETALPWGIYSLERIAAIFLLVAALPLLILAGSMIYLLSGRSALIAHRRVGWHGHSFWMLKLRTMWNRRDVTGAVPSVWIEYLQPEPFCGAKPIRDMRVTSRFAAFCRRHSIDELPQLWHVAEGQMSFVGPRPLTAREWDEHYGQEATEILNYRPGMSGLWQVLGRSRLNYRQRKKLDLRLVRRFSLGLYVAILSRTVAGVVNGKSAW